MQLHGPALRRHAESVEHAFVSVGAALHEETQLAAELVNLGKRFQSFRETTAEANPVRAAIALVNDTLAALEKFQRESGELTADLREEHDRIAQLRQRGSQVERAIAPLRIVDTLFRIEAAGLPTEMQTAFSALTHDIAELDGRVRETFLRHFEALGSMREAIASVLDHLSRQKVENDRLATEQHAAMRQSLGALADEVAWLQQWDQRTAGLVERVGEDTSAVVVGLQYQDITRQKLEHVHEALTALGNRAAASDRRDNLEFARHAAELEASQLTAIDDELSEAIAAIEGGLRKVLDRLHELERDCLETSDWRGLSAKIEGTIASLCEMIDHLRTPMEHAVANANAAARAVHSFGGLTADLGATIRELTWGIRLIALNAQVQAAQVDRCDGLEVLARHTYLVSEETSRSSATLGQELTALHDRLGRLVIRAESFVRQTNTARERLDGEGTRITTEIKRQRDTAVTALHEFTPLLRRLHDHARTLLDGVELAQVDREPLRRMAGELRVLSAWCAQRGARAPRAGALAGEFAALERRYTMDSERAVHAAVLGADQAATTDMAPRSPAVAIEAPNRSATPDLGNNVELF